MQKESNTSSQSGTKQSKMSNNEGLRSSQPMKLSEDEQNKMSNYDELRSSQLIKLFEDELNMLIGLKKH